MNKIKETVKNKKSKIIAIVSMACMIMAMGCVTAFAEGTGSTFPVTSEMLSSVTDNFNSAIAVAAPVGIGIMAIILGVNFVPKLIKKIGH